MSFILSLYMIGASAWASIHPSGFSPRLCRALLAEGATVPEITTFKKMTVPNKVKDVHVLAHFLASATEQSPQDVTDQVVSALLSSQLYETFGPRLEYLSQVDQKRLSPFAQELREISFNLIYLAAVAEQLKMVLLMDLKSFFAAVAALPNEAGDKAGHYWRAMTFLNLALVESELATRTGPILPLLRNSLRHLRYAEIEDARGDRGEIAFSGLSDVLSRIVAVSPELSGENLEIIDKDAEETLVSIMKPFSDGVDRPVFFNDMAQALAEVAQQVSDNDLPLLAEALAEIKTRYASRDLN